MYIYSVHIFNEFLSRKKSKYEKRFCKVNHYILFRESGTKLNIVFIVQESRIEVNSALNRGDYDLSNSSPSTYNHQTFNLKAVKTINNNDIL